MENEWYQLFEAKFRGEETLIKNRLKVYLPFIVPLFKLHPDGKALDLGCGRGEWLELLTEEGIKAIGLDVNVAFITYCQQKKLTVIEEDVLTFLQKQEAGSWLLISAFHVVEHLSFEYLQKLIKEAHRVLQSGGLLILETPNPDNLRVASVTFWFDPTHKRLLPKELLAFLIEQDFYRHKILGLNETKASSSKEIRWSELYTAVSPDYAIIGQKAGDKKNIHSVNDAFNTKYGFTLEEVLEKYEKSRKKEQIGLELRIEVLEKHEKIMEKEQIDLELRIKELEKQISHIKPLFRIIFLLKRVNLRKFWKFKKQ